MMIPGDKTEGRDSGSDGSDGSDVGEGGHGSVVSEGSDAPNGSDEAPPPVPSTVSPDEVSDVAITVGQVSYLRGFMLATLLLCGTLLALFGVLYVARGTPVHGVVVEGRAGLPPAVNDPLFARSIVLHADVSMPGASDVQVLLDGDGTFPAMWEDIRSAQRSITFQMYYFLPGVLADSLAEHLIERARAGVRVLMLLDAFGARTLRPAYLNRLRSAGVEIAHLRPFTWYRLEKASHRSHVRSLVVDGEIGYTGGFGIGDQWLGNGDAPEEWRETNVRLTGPVVLQIQAAFMSAWSEVTGELLTGAPYFPDTLTSEGEIQAGYFHFAPSVGSAAAERFLALTIATARSTLYISNAYFVPDGQFREMLKAAAQRGVDVRILTTSELTDIKATRYAARGIYEELLSAGVRIYEFQPSMVHSKTFVVDGFWSSVGSLNFDNRSLAYNDEANFVVLDSGIGATMNSIFMRDLESAKEIKLDEFRQRGVLERVLEFGSRLVSSLL